MVAPSFQQFKRVTDPYIKGAHRYVDVKNPKTGAVRSVRWYTDAEYAKAYGSKLVDTDRGYDGLKHARGFDNGPILVVRGNVAADDKWLGLSPFRYAVGIGWYLISTEKFPDDAPKHFKYLALSWEEFRDGDDRHMKTPSQLADILTNKARAKEWIPISSSCKKVGD